jgi:hypothetical protein
MHFQPEPCRPFAQHNDSGSSIPAAGGSWFAAHLKPAAQFLLVAAQFPAAGISTHQL